MLAVCVIKLKRETAQEKSNTYNYKVSYSVSQLFYTRSVLKAHFSARWEKKGGESERAREKKSSKLDSERQKSIASNKVTVCSFLLFHLQSTLSLLTFFHHQNISFAFLFLFPFPYLRPSFSCGGSTLVSPSVQCAVWYRIFLLLLLLLLVSSVRLESRKSSFWCFFLISHNSFEIVMKNIYNTT